MTEKEEKINWTEREREQNRRMVVMLLDKVLTEQKAEGRTTKQFFHSLTMALGQLSQDDMITLDEASLLVTKYMMLYDPNWRVPTTDEELEQFYKDYPIGEEEEEEEMK